MGQVYFLELGLGAFIAGVNVRVVLARQPAVGLLDVFLSGVPFNAQNLVIVFRHIYYLNNLDTIIKLMK
jgi:hypothetical protein